MESIYSEICEAISVSEANFLHQNTYLLAQQLAESRVEHHRVRAAKAFLMVGEFVCALELTAKLCSDSARYLHGVAALFLGDYASAERSLLIARSPLTAVKGSKGLYQLGITFEKTGKWDLAAESFGAAYTKDRTLFDALKRKIALEKRLDAAKGNASLGGEGNKNSFDEFLRSGQLCREMHAPMRRLEPESSEILTYKTAKINILQKRLGATQHARCQPQGFPVQKSMVSKKRVSSSVLHKISKKSKENHSKSLRKNESELASFIARLGSFLEILEKGKVREATEYLSAKVPSIKSSFFINTELGRCAASNGLYSEAEKHFSAANELSPLSVDGKEYYSSCLWSLGRTPKLVSLAAAMFTHHPFDFRTWMVIGNCFSALGDHVSSHRFFGKAVSLNPMSAYAYCLRGHEEAALSDLAAAQQSYIHSIALDPLQIFAHWGLGSIALRTEKYSDAVAHFNRALKISPKLALLHTCIANAYAECFLTVEAEEHFVTAASIDRESPANNYHYARLLHQLGRNWDALKVAQSLTRSRPGDPEVHVLMGNINFGLHEFEKAEAEYLQALSLDPANAQAKHLLEIFHSGVDR